MSAMRKSIANRSLLHPWARFTELALRQVKKLRSKFSVPILPKTISIDVAILYRLVKLTNRFFPKANENADWEGMLHEFHHTIFEELDYVKEGRNADRFRYNFRTWRAVRVPKIFWTHTSTRVLTLEFIRGTKVVDLEGFVRGGFRRSKLIGF